MSLKLSICIRVNVNMVKIYFTSLDSLVLWKGKAKQYLNSEEQITERYFNLLLLYKKHRDIDHHIDFL